MERFNTKEPVLYKYTEIAMSIKVLHIEEDKNICSKLSDYFNQNSSNIRYECYSDINSLDNFLVSTNLDKFDCIICNHSQMIDSISIYKSHISDKQNFIIFTNNGDEKLAFKSSKIGIFDYIIKDTDNFNELEKSINRAIQNSSNKDENDIESINILIDNMPYPAFVRNKHNKSIKLNQHFNTNYDDSEYISESKMAFVQNNKQIFQKMDEEIKDSGVVGDYIWIGDQEYFVIQSESDQNDNIIFGMIIDQDDINTDNLKTIGQIHNLHAVLNKLFSTSEYSKASSIILEAFKNNFGYDIVVLWVEEGDRLVPKCTTNRADEVLETSQVTNEKGKSLSYDAYEEDKIKIVNDMDSKDGKYNTDTKIKSEAIIPIPSIGVVNVASLTKNSFSQEEAKMMKLWSKILLVAVDRVKKRNKLKHKKQEVIDEKNRLEDFVSFVTHDIRNPLQVAKGNVDIVRSERDNDRLDTVSKSLDRIEQIIYDVRVLTNQKNGSLDKEEVFIEKIVDKCWDNVKTSKSNINNNVNLKVYADKSKLSHIFENLFRNSITHGGPDVDIIIDNLENNKGFYIQDTGSGIDKSMIDEIFESGVSSERNSSGLGLKIVSEIIKLHNWDIEVENTDEGARFNIYTK